MLILNRIKYRSNDSIRFEISNIHPAITDNDYIVGRQQVKSLQVVIDADEQGEASIRAFSGVLTN